jgi:DivIVA domain-containing protein
VALVIVVLVGIAALTGVAVLLGMSESPLSTEPVDRVDDGLPERQLTSGDVGGLRFRIGMRGYRMDDVDLALDRLRDALRDAETRSAAAEQALAEHTVATQTLVKPTRSGRASKPADADEGETLAKPPRARRLARQADTPPDDGA